MSKALPQPEIFNQIIRDRVSNYIEKEVKALIAAKTNEIIEDVMRSLKTDAQMFQDLMRYEQRLVITCIYNGVEITDSKQAGA